jgi:GDP-L-fucose synthase
VTEEEAWSGPPHPTYAGYGWLKRSLERLAEFVASKSNVKIAIVRPTAVYGRYDSFDPRTGHVIPALISRALEREDPFEVWGTGDEVRDFVHVTDVVRAGLLALERHATCDAVNIGSGEPTTIRQLVDCVLAATGHANTRVIFNPSKPTTIPFRMVNIAKATRVLGYTPRVALAEGIADTVTWFQTRPSAVQSSMCFG